MGVIRKYSIFTALVQDGGCKGPGGEEERRGKERTGQEKRGGKEERREERRRGGRKDRKQRGRMLLQTQGC